MKTAYKIILAVLFIAFIACDKVTFTNSENNKNASIVGTWSLVNYHEIEVDLNTNKTIFDSSANIITDGVTSYILIQFFSNGTYFYKTDFDFDTMKGDTTDVDTEKGTYTITQDSLTTMKNGDKKNSITIKYSISDNHLITTTMQEGLNDNSINVKLTSIATYEKQP